MTRTLCGLMLLFAIGCSNLTDGADAGTDTTTDAVGTNGDQSSMECGRRIMRAGHDAAVATARLLPRPSCRQSDDSITASWPYQSGNRTGTLYANFIFENNAWASLLVGHR